MKADVKRGPEEREKYLDHKMSFRADLPISNRLLIQDCSELRLEIESSVTIKNRKFNVATQSLL